MVGGKNTDLTAAFLGAEALNAASEEGYERYSFWTGPGRGQRCRRYNLERSQVIQTYKSESRHINCISKLELYWFQRGQRDCHTVRLQVHLTARQQLTSGNPHMRIGFAPRMRDTVLTVLNSFVGGVTKEFQVSFFSQLENRQGRERTV